jgi:hypothetical protein
MDTTPHQGASFSGIFTDRSGEILSPLVQALVHPDRGMRAPPSGGWPGFREGHEALGSDG